MTFSGNQAFLIQSGKYTPIAPTQGLTLFSGSYIIHRQGGGNIYPPSGRVTDIGGALNGLTR